MKTNVYSTVELHALAAANAPNPSREIIEMYHKYDIEKNPLNERGLPKWRTELEIIADYKLDFADTLFKRFDQRQA